MTTYRSNENWFNLPSGCYCGVAIKEKTARKLQKLLWKQTEEIKDFLTAHKEDCVPYHWTLAYPNGKQTTVHYTCPDTTVEERIKLFDKAGRINHIDNLFVTNERYNKASEEVQWFYEEMYGGEDE